MDINKEVEISIILPTFNRGYILSEAIDSVLAQTFQEWELIVVDDGSRDDTAKVMQRYLDLDKRIIYIRNEVNMGANCARNYGISHAKGRFLAFLDSDNYWKHDKLQKQFSALRNSEASTALVFCRVEVRGNGKKWLLPCWGFREEEVGNRLLKRNMIDTNTVLLKREALEQCGNFDEALPRLQEWELLFRIIVVFGYHAIYLNEVLNVNVMQDDSLSQSSKKYIDAMFYLRRKHKGYFYEKTVTNAHMKDMVYQARADLKYLKTKIMEENGQDRDMLMECYCGQLENINTYYRLLYRWKLMEGTDGSATVFERFFAKQNAKVVIYGLGEWGELVYQEMKNSNVTIPYVMDQSKISFHGLPVKNMGDELEKVDYIIVTLFAEFHSIKQALEKHGIGTVLSIEQIIGMDGY